MRNAKGRFVVKLVISSAHREQCEIGIDRIGSFASAWYIPYWDGIREVKVCSR